MIHAKKIAPEFFEAAVKGKKPFELRREDPNEPRYEVGDYLALNEFVVDHQETELGVLSVSGRYTGNCRLYEITYVLRDYELLPPDVVALGLKLKPLRFDEIDGTALANLK